MAPAIAKADPIEEKRLDRLLDRMLYRLEDRDEKSFIPLREELTKSIARFFNGFPSPERARFEKAD